MSNRSKPDMPDMLEALPFALKDARSAARPGWVSHCEMRPYAPQYIHMC